MAVVAAKKEEVTAIEPKKPAAKKLAVKAPELKK